MWLYLFHLYCLDGSYAFNAIFYNVFLYFWEALDFFSLILPKSERLGHHSAFLCMEIGSYLVKVCHQRQWRTLYWYWWSHNELCYHILIPPSSFSPSLSLLLNVWRASKWKRTPPTSLHFKPIYKDCITDKKPLNGIVDWETPLLDCPFYSSYW